jgi:hypothetical protein
MICDFEVAERAERDLADVIGRLLLIRNEFRFSAISPRPNSVH